MTRAPLFLSFGLALAVVLGGCSAVPGPAAADAAPVAAAPATTVETIPFRTGVSSATVEKMARQQGCTGGPGAALITEPGPVEVYRMRCEDGPMSGAPGGQVFMARCELRQCKRM